MKPYLWVTMLMLSMTMNVGAADDPALKKSIQAIVLENLKAAQKESLEALMQTMHKASPVYEATRTQSELIFSQFRLRYKIHAIHVIGQDGDFAFARVEITTTKVEGSGFRDNRTSLLQVFKKEGDQWKYWNQLLLDINFLSP